MNVDQVERQSYLQKNQAGSEMAHKLWRQSLRSAEVMTGGAYLTATGPHDS